MQHRAGVPQLPHSKKYYFPLEGGKGYVLQTVKLVHDMQKDGAASCILG